MSDEQLVKQCIEGIKASQKTFYERFAGKMMAVCLRYASTLEDAEDYLQDGFVRTFEKLHTFRFEGSLEGWVRRIMVNEAITNLRRKADFSSVELTETMPIVADSSSKTDHLLNARELLALISALPTGYRTIFNLYAIEGYNHNEIAELLGISVGTSKSQYARAKAVLQKKLNIKETQVQEIIK